MPLRYAHRLCQAPTILLLLGLALPCWAEATPGKFARDRARKPLPTEAFKFSKNKLAGNPDPTFDGHHPAFQRLVRKGWFTNNQRRHALQKAANKLKDNRRLSLARPLEAEFLALDFEASERRSGKFDRKKGAFLSGWDEITEIGFALFRNGKVVDRGSIKVRPDVEIGKEAAKLTGLNAQKLANAPHFEDPAVADKLLKLMHGRPIVGQGFQKNDWAWLRSSLARMGVDMPKPKRMVIDTHLLSYALDGPSNGAKRSVGALAEREGIVVQGQLHGALVDAETNGHLFLAQMKRGQATDFAAAFRLMHEGYQVKATEQRAKAEQQRQKAQAASVK